MNAAHAAGRTKHTAVGARYRALVARRGKKRGAVAVAHTLLTIAYHVLRDHEPYDDLAQQPEDCAGGHPSASISSSSCRLWASTSPSLLGLRRRDPRFSSQHQNRRCSTTSPRGTATRRLRATWALAIRR